MARPAPAGGRRGRRRAPQLVVRPRPSWASTTGRSTRAAGGGRRAARRERPPGADRRARPRPVTGPAPSPPTSSAGPSWPSSSASTRAARRSRCTSPRCATRAPGRGPRSGADLDLRRPRGRGARARGGRSAAPGLVTVAGTGGVGKSRLAARVAGGGRRGRLRGRPAVGLARRGRRGRAGRLDRRARARRGARARDDIEPRRSPTTWRRSDGRCSFWTGASRSSTASASLAARLLAAVPAC